MLCYLLEKTNVLGWVYTTNFSSGTASTIPLPWPSVIRTSWMHSTNAVRMRPQTTSAPCHLDNRKLRRDRGPSPVQPLPQRALLLPSMPEGLLADARKPLPAP